MSLMWIPAHTTLPPGARFLSAAGDERSRGGEDDRRVELLGRRVVAAARPGGAERARELLRALVAGPGEGVHLSPLVHGDLADHVGGRSESVQAQPGGVTGEAQRSVADQASAQQRRQLLVGHVWREIETEALVGDRQLGKPPSMSRPVKRAFTQRFSRPLRQ